MTAEYGSETWSQALPPSTPASYPAQDLATLLLAINYELLGYSPEQAWMLARRGESAAPGNLDG